MVTIKSKLLSFMIAALSISLLIGGCAGTGSQNDQPRSVASDDPAGNENSPGDTDDGDLSDTEQEEVSENRMRGPDLPPEGVRYDEWKGFQYSKDISFKVRSYWSFSMSDHSLPSSHGLTQDPENIEDGVLTITSAKSEPVGGEMKLRSGGFVDITIELQWTGTMNGSEDLSANRNYNVYWGVGWLENGAYPCDAYTGTSLLNYVDNSSSDDKSMLPGQATASSMVESDITWENRTYRLFAQSDVRNASSHDWTTDFDGDRYLFSIPGTVETTLSFRIPADYDGLVLAIDKDITDEKSANIDERGEFLYFDDLYADILTTASGVKQTADDFYFVRVSDLLDHFADDESAVSQD